MICVLIVVYTVQHTGTSNYSSGDNSAMSASITGAVEVTLRYVPSQITDPTGRWLRFEAVEAVDVSEATWKPVSVQRWATLLAGDQRLAKEFVLVLRATPYPAYFFETKGASAATSSKQFEFVVVDAPSLAGVTPEPHAFAEHLDCTPPAAAGCAFTNLGGDAMLVAPRKSPGPVAAGAQGSDYAHLATFVKQVPLQQTAELMM